MRDEDLVRPRIPALRLRAPHYLELERDESEGGGHVAHLGDGDGGGGRVGWCVLLRSHVDNFGGWRKVGECGGKNW